MKKGAIIAFVALATSFAVFAAVGNAGKAKGECCDKSQCCPMGTSNGNCCGTGCE